MIWLALFLAFGNLLTDLYFLNMVLCDDLTHHCVKAFKTEAEISVIFLTISLFTPHALFVFSELLQIKLNNVLQKSTVLFEMSYILAGGYVLVVWSVSPGIERAEPVFVLVGVSLATFELRRTLVDRVTTFLDTRER